MPGSPSSSDTVYDSASPEGAILELTRLFGERRRGRLVFVDSDPRHFVQRLAHDYCWYPPTRQQRFTALLQLATATTVVRRVAQCVAELHGVIVVASALLHLLRAELLPVEELAVLVTSYIAAAIKDSAATSLISGDAVFAHVDWSQATVRGLVPRRDELPAGSTLDDFNREFRRRLAPLLALHLHLHDLRLTNKAFRKNRVLAVILAHWFIERHELLCCNSTTQKQLRVDDVRVRRLAQQTLNHLVSRHHCPAQRDADETPYRFVIATRDFLLNHARLAQRWERWYSPACPYTRMPECLYLTVVARLVACQQALPTEVDFPVAKIAPCRAGATTVTGEQHKDDDDDEEAAALFEHLCDFVAYYVASIASAVCLTAASRLTDLIVQNSQLRQGAAAFFRSSNIPAHTIVQHVRRRVARFLASRSTNGAGRLQIAELPRLGPHLFRHISQQRWAAYIGPLGDCKMRE